MSLKVLPTRLLHAYLRRHLRGTERAYVGAKRIKGVIVLDHANEHLRLPVDVSRGAHQAPERSVWDLFPLVSSGGGTSPGL